MALVGKIESARLLFPLPIVPRVFFSLSPALPTVTEASPKGSLLCTASRSFINKYHISRSRKMLEKLEKTSIWHNVYLAQFLKTNLQKFAAI